MNSFITPFPWSRYSKKLIAKVEKLRCAGFFTTEESIAREMFLAEGSAGFLNDGNLVHLYWLVDKEDGIIVDAKFQAFGQSALLGAAETACELLIGKNYDQAKRITALLIDQQVQEKSDLPAFPPETAPHLNLVLEAIENAAEKCSHISLPSGYFATPMPTNFAEMGEKGHPEWVNFSTEQKIAMIEEILDRDIRPYIALDAGGVEVLNLLDNEVIIAYSGSCTSCYSSVGTTLSYIQQTLRAKAHPDLRVTPQL